MQINSALAPIQICHCRSCQKAQGAAFAAVIPVAIENFIVQTGADQLCEYESSPGKFRAFCRRCGSPVISRRASNPNVVRVRTGIINEDVPTTVAHHAFVAEREKWCEMHDDSAQFNGAAP